MSWTTPRTWATGELVTAAMMNTHLRDNTRESGPGIAIFMKEGTLVTGTGQARFYVPSSWGVTKIRGVTLSVGTAPTGSAVIVDVNKNGTTIWTTQGNRPQIAAASNGGTEDIDMDVSSVAGGDYFTVDIDQVGSTTAGKDLVVEIRFGRE